MDVKESNAKNKDPLVSIVILNWNRCNDLRETLNLTHEINYENIEIIVVDNGSTDSSKAMVREHFPLVNLISLPTNIGCEDGNNVGILNSNGEYIFFLDNDADIEPSGLREIVTMFQKDDRLGIVEPRIIRPADGKILNEPKHWPVRNCFMGCAVVIRAKVFDDIGLRPGEYFLYASEPDICIKTIESGYTIKHCADIVARHRESPENRASKNFYKLATRNFIWLIWRYYPTRSAMYETLLLLIVHFLRSIKHRAFFHFLSGIMLGFLGFYKQAIKKRHPMSRFNEARVFPGFNDLKRILIRKFKMDDERGKVR